MVKEITVYIYENYIIPLYSVTELKMKPIDYFDTIITNFLTNRYKDKYNGNNTKINYNNIPNDLFYKTKESVIKDGYKSENKFIFYCLCIINDILKSILTA